MKSIWEHVKSFLKKHIKGSTIQLALKKILGAEVFGGFKLMIVKYIVTHLYDELAEPLVELALRKIEYSYERTKGKILIKKLQRAEDENNTNDYNNSVDSILR